MNEYNCRNGLQKAAYTGWQQKIPDIPTMGLRKQQQTVQCGTVSQPSKLPRDQCDLQPSTNAFSALPQTTTIEGEGHW